MRHHPLVARLGGRMDCGKKGRRTFEFAAQTRAQFTAGANFIGGKLGFRGVVQDPLKQSFCVTKTYLATRLSHPITPLKLMPLTLP